MNKTIILVYIVIFAFITLVNTLFAQSTNKNYIKSVEVFSPVKTEAEVSGMPSSSQHKRVSISYFDGLGRAIQTITLAKSPSGKDVVQHIAYDQFDRQPKKYLPFTKSNGYGAFIDDAGQLQTTFYSGNPDPNIPNTTNPYSETRFEASPLNRPIESASPGNSWAISTGHTTSYQHLVNHNDNVWLWKESNGTITNNGMYYSNGKLYKEVIVDEDGNSTITFTTIDGKKILVRKISDGQQINTYYVYNIFNQLTCVIMPQAVIASGAFSDWKNAFRYFYDKRGRIIEKWLPGNQPVYYVYNKANLLVFEQHGNNRENYLNKWRFYKYDGLGRIIIEGSYHRNITRSALQAELDNQAILFEKKDFMEGQFNSYFGYSNDATPQLRNTSYQTNPEVVYYYDNYDFNCDNDAETEYNQFWNTSPNFSDAANKSPHGQVVAKLIVPSIYEVTFFDIYNRPVQLYNNQMHTGYQYFYNGSLKMTKNSYTYAPGQEINYTFENSYDNNWRPTGTTFTMNGTTIPLNTLQYNELGQLGAKYLHGNASSYLQRQIYSYNARGWLTAINNPYQCANDVFALKIHYDQVPYYASSIADSRYNGNISLIEWHTRHHVATNYIHGYGFTYDGLNRLTAGKFYRRLDPTTIFEPSPTYDPDGIVSGIGSEKEITYDRNGNILTLNRYGQHTGGSVMFDQLSYQYDGNRLMRVTDAKTNSYCSGEFRNTAAEGLQNTYDANGNITFDVDRNMMLYYNDDNLPVSISYSGWAITNTYRPDGTKTHKNVYDAGGRTVLREEYKANLVLSFGLPSQIIHADGVIDLTNLNRPMLFYHLKDHLGNVRAVVSPTPTGNPNVDQVTEYYPFGMSISKNFTTLPVNKYKYNSKEEQEMPGRWLDYGARFYDAQLGRWHGVDPLAENYRRWTPYNYCVNNPMRYIDPDGMRLDEFGIDKETGKISKLNSNQYYKTSKGTVKPLPQGESTEGKNMVDKVVNSEGQSKYFSAGSLGREQDSSEEYQSFSFSAQEAEAFYYFAAESSEVEWTYASTKYGGGHVGTDYNSSETQMPGYYESIYGSSLDKISHSHPGSGGGPSYDIWTKNGRAGDLNAANNSPLNIKREVYDVPNRTIYGYSKETYNAMEAYLYKNSTTKPILYDYTFKR